MYKMDTKNYAATIRNCYGKKVPLFVYGGPGIGKSEIPRQVFKDIVKEMNAGPRSKNPLKYIEWTSCSLVDKKEIILNPDKYFVFCDQRVGQMDSTDLRGIPNLIDKDMLETIPMSWVVYFTQKNAHGAIFFDELNLAAPTVAGQAYQIINERAVSDRNLGEDVFVFGAGNRPGIDQAHTFDMPFPLRDRFCEFEVEPNVTEWTKWATGHVNSHLVAFVNWKESYLYNVDKNSANKSSTPRGIVRASRLIGEDDVTSNEVFASVSISCGEGFAIQFKAYCKHFQSLNWDSIFKNPASIEKFETDKLWACIGGLAEQYNKFEKTYKSKKEIQKRFDEITQIILYMRADFAIVGLRLMKDGDVKKFSTLIRNCAHIDEVSARYQQYIVN